MSSSLRTVNPQQLVSLLILASSLFFYCFLISSTLNNSWFFDDWENLKGLREVTDLHSAYQFITTGISSPLGRPISLASFLLNIGDWLDNDPAGFRVVSAALHCINTLLIFLFVLNLSKLVGSLTDRKFLIAAIVSASWLLLPLNFSSFLMPVQRMTVLAGTFTILGLLSFVVLRRKLTTESRWEWHVLLVLVVAGFSILGLLSKETGLLLPLYCFVLEKTIFKDRQPLTSNKWQWNTTKSLLYGVPIFGVIGYFLLNGANFVGGYINRPFTLQERVGTELVILFEYLMQIFVPQITKFGPFHDDHSVYSLASLPAALAFVMWMVLLLGAFKIRNKFKWVLFAVSWYLIGHVLESTVIALELYFEHRNYIPSLGVVIGLVFSLGSLNGSWYRASYVFLLITVFTFWRLASLWSSPALAAEMMVTYHPQSVRASSHLATLYEVEDVGASYQIISKASKRIPDSASLAFDALYYSCFIGKKAIEDEMTKIAGLPDSIRVDYISSITKSLDQIYNLKKEDKCDGLKIEELLANIDSFSQKASVVQNGEMQYRLSIIRASLALEIGDVSRAIANYTNALSIKRYPALIARVAKLLMAQSNYKEAEEFVRTQNEQLDWRTVEYGAYWQREILGVWTLICKQEDIQCDE